MALPPEMCREILARLSVKSILLYRSVCKSWYSLVSCPDFISHHSLTNQHDKNGDRVLLQLLECSVMSFSFHGESCVEFGDHGDDCSDHFLGRQLTIIGSCNGLICLSGLGYDTPNNDVTTVTFFLWNPSIRKIVDLPSLTYITFTQHCSHVGFGLDPKTSDYKVMCNVRDSSLGGNVPKNVCEIFDLSKGVWRIVNPRMPSPIPWRPEAECYVEGAVYWSNNSDRVLLSFNVSDECFLEIKMPDCAEFTPSDGDLIKTRCVAFEGLVHVIVFKQNWDDNVYDFFVDISKSCSIWAMKEYGATKSWIKVFNIDLLSAQVLPSTQICRNFFILWAEGEVLIVHHLPVDEEEDVRNKQDLVLYNIGTRKSKHIFSTTKYVVGTCLYKESLVLM